VFNGLGCIANLPGAQVNSSGFIGGVEAGYNWQMSPSWLIGIEADFQGSDINGSVNVAGPFNIVGFGPVGGASYIASERLNYFGTIRPRVGFVMNQALIYATGGLAYGGGNVSDDLIGTGVSYPASSSFTRAGWTVGGGVEYAFAPNWSAKLEGLYYDLGRVSVLAGSTQAATGFTFGKGFDVNGGIVRVGVNYKFF